MIIGDQHTQAVADRADVLIDVSRHGLLRAFTHTQVLPRGEFTLAARNGGCDQPKGRGPGRTGPRRIVRSLRARHAVDVDLQGVGIPRGLRHCPGGVSGRIAGGVAAIRLGDRALSGEAAREGEVARRAVDGGRLLTRDPVGLHGDDRAAVDPRRAGGTARAGRPRCTVVAGRAGRTSITLRALGSWRSLDALDALVALGTAGTSRAGGTRDTDRAPSSWRSLDALDALVALGGVDAGC